MDITILFEMLFKLCIVIVIISLPMITGVCIAAFMEYIKERKYIYKKR